LNGSLSFENGPGTPGRATFLALSLILDTLAVVVVIMKSKKGLQVGAATAIPVPTLFALPALETILKEFERPGNASLALDLQRLHASLQAFISVPVDVAVWPGETRFEWRLRIRAASSPRLYPAFEGVLTLMPVGGSGSQLQLDGAYVPPFGAAGRTVDFTFLHGAAHTSLQRFVREIGNRALTLSRWSRLA